LYKKAASILEDLILKEGHPKKCGNELSVPIPDVEEPTTIANQHTT